MKNIFWYGRWDKTEHSIINSVLSLVICKSVQAAELNVIHYIPL